MIYFDPKQMAAVNFLVLQKNEPVDVAASPPAVINW